MIFLLAAALTLPAQLDRKVDFEGHTYRVQVRGRAVTVADKALVTNRTPEQGDRMRRAVIQLTGCELRDGYWVAAKLRGLLVCPT